MLKQNNVKTKNKYIINKRDGVRGETVGFPWLKEKAIIKSEKKKELKELKKKKEKRLKISIQR